MSKTDAEYMRAYRARKKAEQRPGPDDPDGEVALLRLAWETADRERTALQAEVKHLKAELATRPKIHPAIERMFPLAVDRSFNSRPFTPAPKKGK